MLQIPPFLQAQDQVALIAPAGKVPKEAIKYGVDLLQNWGLVPIVGQYAAQSHERFYALSAPDTERLEDLQTAMNNPNIKAIICLRGGYGTGRLLPKLDWRDFQKHPKWIVGFSDITALHAQLQRYEICSLHGVMPVNFNLPDNQIALDTLHAALFGQYYRISSPAHRQNKLGNAQAEVLGGNLSMLVSTLGTPYEIQTEGKILFVEEIGEVPYRFDRLLGQLSHSGKLDKLAGLIVGGLLGFKEETNYSQGMLNEIVLEYVEDNGYPISFDFPVGHQAQNATMICGADARFEVNSANVTLDFSSFASI